MAQSDMTLFDALSLEIGDGTFVLGTDAFAVVLITTLPLATQTTPNLSDFTEVSNGGGYTTAGIDLTESWTRSVKVATFDDSGSPDWTASAGSPTNIVAALVIKTSTGAAAAFIDMTVDGGSTPISLVAGDINIDWNALGLFTVTIT